MPSRMWPASSATWTTPRSSGWSGTASTSTGRFLCDFFRDPPLRGRRFPMRWSRTFVIAGLLAVVGCGGSVVADDDGGAPGADSGTTQAPASPTDVVSAGGRMSGGRFTLDFQVGQVTDRRAR